MRVMHVVTGLSSGGAESMLAALVTADATSGADVSVVTLVPGGLYHDRLLAAGIKVVSLDMRRGLPSPVALWRLAARIRAERPDVIQSWMYHADLLATVAWLLAGRRRHTRLYWGIRCSDMDLSRYGLQLRIVIRLLAWLSGLPDGVVANSRRGLAVHRAAGYHPRRFHLVHNGIDAERFRPDPDARAAIRRQLGIAADTPLVAMVARNDPMKDYPTFYAAMERLAGVEALVVGAGTADLPVRPGLHRLGIRPDMPALLVACDLVVSSSAYGEGLSNAVAEGMACGLPAVVTDTGDSRLLVGGTGYVVAPGDAEGLAAAVRRLLDDAQRASLGTAARRRIVECFSLARAVDAFRAVHAGGAADGALSAPPGCEPTE